MSEFDDSYGRSIEKNNNSADSQFQELPTVTKWEKNKRYILDGSFLDYLQRAITRTTPRPNKYLVKRQEENGIHFDVSIEAISQAINEFQGATSGCYAWKSEIKNEGDGLTGWKIRFNPGTIDGMVATNWDDWLDVTVSNDPDNPEISYIKAKVKSIGFQISSWEIVIEPTPDIVNDITADAPPTEFTILLGILADTECKMEWNGNLIAKSLLIRREGLNASPGEYPYRHWYQWGWSTDLI